MDSEEKMKEEGKLPRLSNSPVQTRKDFWKGFWDCVALNFIVFVFANLLVSVLSIGFPGKYLSYVSPVVLGLIPLGTNISVMVYYARKNRPMVSIGMLAAFSVVFTTCLALSAVCFSPQ